MSNQNFYFNNLLHLEELKEKDKKYILKFLVKILRTYYYHVTM
jgi:hypothetical protein